MSIRNLEFALKPRSVALIGASKQPGSVGSVLARNLFKGGFDGPMPARTAPAARVAAVRPLGSNSKHQLPLLVA